MRYKRKMFLTILALISGCLCGCVQRTNTVTLTVYDVGFRFLNAGNMRLTEWGGIPEGYIEYKGSYIRSYHYVFKHDGTVSFDATYGFEKSPGEGLYEEHETGTYSSRVLGPNQTIDIVLPSRRAKWTWEPNPRNPIDSLVFRTYEKRVMDFGAVDDAHSAMENVEVFLMFYSERVSPRPL